MVTTLPAILSTTTTGRPVVLPAPVPSRLVSQSIKHLNFCDTVTFLFYFHWAKTVATASRPTTASRSARQSYTPSPFSCPTVHQSPVPVAPAKVKTTLLPESVKHRTGDSKIDVLPIRSVNSSGPIGKPAPSRSARQSLLVQQPALPVPARPRNIRTRNTVNDKSGGRMTAHWLLPQLNVSSHNCSTTSAAVASH